MTDKTNVNSKKYFNIPVIIYHPEYNVRFWGFERMHPLDSCKYEKIAARIVQNNSPTLRFLEPTGPASDEELKKVHTEEFLTNLYNSKVTIVSTSEACVFYFFTRNAINSRLLRPLRFQVSGTLLACQNAWTNGSSINLGGGFHHCSAIKSDGFCFFADITMAIRYVWSELNPDCRILIIDGDAHQGNGYARDVLFRMNKAEQAKVFILDLYNPRIYPRDDQAKEAINREVCLPWKVGDEQYLKLLKYHLDAVTSIDKFQPNFIIFNAGSDILANDPLGCLAISGEGLQKRDQMVFEFAATNNRIPIVMLLSGGYSRSNWLPVAESINCLLKLDIFKIHEELLDK